MFFQIFFHQTECQFVGSGRFRAAVKALRAKIKNNTGLGGYLRWFYYFCGYTYIYYV